MKGEYIWVERLEKKGGGGGVRERTSTTTSHRIPKCGWSIDQLSTRLQDPCTLQFFDTCLQERSVGKVKRGTLATNVRSKEESVSVALMTFS